jgi:hypothetical protein
VDGEKSKGIEVPSSLVAKILKSKGKENLG